MRCHPLLRLVPPLKTKFLAMGREKRTCGSTETQKSFSNALAGNGTLCDTDSKTLLRCAGDNAKKSFIEVKDEFSHACSH